ncbi:MAG: DUF1573 domain-containing protein [Puniceicoccales bacterium]
MIRLLLIFLAVAPLFLRAELDFETTTIDVDAKVGDSEYTGVYPFTNTGNEPVTIERVISSCGCTVPKLAKETYAPGESGELAATFDFGARTGAQSKVITVFIEGQRDKPIRLHLKVNIPEVLSIKPRVVSWRAEEPRETKSIVIVVGDAVDGELRLADPLPNDFTVELKADKDNPNRYVLNVTPATADSDLRNRFNVELVAPNGKPIASVAGFLIAKSSR